MTWRNIQLVFFREVRDQLRDRRTLFVIVVLPWLMYAFLGMTMMQVQQLSREQSSRVTVVGAEELEGLQDIPPLFRDRAFADPNQRPAQEGDGPASADEGEAAPVEDETTLAESENEDATEALPDQAPPQPTTAENLVSPLTAISPLIELQFEDAKDGGTDDLLAAAKTQLDAGELDAVVYFPPGFGERLAAFREQVLSTRDDPEAQRAAQEEFQQVVTPVILYDSAEDRSKRAYYRVSDVLDAWASAVGRQTLIESRLPVDVAKPFVVEATDVAKPASRKAAVWSKILPLVLIIWSLTGAFNPAVDVCAGEKERGTLETLLASPALREEIVWGKLLTVMLFSMVTSLLNLLSIGITAHFLLGNLAAGTSSQLASLGVPPVGAIALMLVAMVPISALFGALCVALAAFARSTKEGQYYLIPLLVVVLPLVIAPMLPNVQLNLGTALVPIMGMVLLLKTAIEGGVADVLVYTIPVACVTAICCYLAIRWAVLQFSSETVLFRESERFDLRHWMIHLVRDRSVTPSVGAAFACGALILLLRFFMQLNLANQSGEPDFFQQTLVLQLTCILTPALLMTLFFTKAPFKTLLLDHRPRLMPCIMAIALGIAMRPLGDVLARLILQMYPVNPLIGEQLEGLTAKMAGLPFLATLGFFALLPAVVEELAFRGFILSGLRHLGRKWWAIGISAAFFGATHGVVQQSLGAFVIGIVIGYIAVQTSSLIPCVLFHFVYNGLGVTAGRLKDWLGEQPSELAQLVWQPILKKGEIAVYEFTLPVTSAAAVIALYLLLWFQKQSYDRSTEEELTETRDMRYRESIA